MVTELATPERTAAARADASPLETALVLAGGVWLLVGLFIDGYAHSEIIDTETEDFFTPWHAIFYSGFAFSAAVIAWMAARRLQPGGSLLRGALAVLPAGYRAAAVGLVIFAVGGIGDGVWHTIFGVETSIDALLSPTHLVLLTGLVLILAAPLSAAWSDRAPRVGWAALGVPIVSATLVLSLVAFFLSYAFGLTETWPLEIRYFPRDDVNGDIVALGLSMSYLATFILVATAIALLRRWSLPTGALAAVWAVPVALTAFAFGGDAWSGLPAAAAGGFAVERAAAMLRRWLPRERALIAAIGAGTGVMWSVWMLIAAQRFDVVWQAELWSGLILMNAGLALGVAIAALVPTPGVTPTND